MPWGFGNVGIFPQIDFALKAMAREERTIPIPMEKEPMKSEEKKDIDYEVVDRDKSGDEEDDIEVEQEDPVMNKFWDLFPQLTGAKPGNRRTKNFPLLDIDTDDMETKKIILEGRQRMMDENLQYNQILPMLKDGEDFWCVFKHGLIRDDESMDTLKAKIREYLDEMAEIEKESESPEEIKEAHEELSKCLREINGEKFDKPIHKKMEGMKM